MNVEVEVSDHFDAFHNDADALGECAQTFPFARLDWFRRLTEFNEAKGPQGSPLILRAADGPAVLWMFLMRTGGGHARGLANYYSFAFETPSSNADASTRLALLSAIAARLRRSGVSSLLLTPLNARAMEDHVRAFGAAGWRAEALRSSIRWSLPVRGRSFDEYWASRPGALRTTVKRKGARAKPRIEIDTVFTDAAWADYAEVYAASWKPEEGNLPLLRAFAEAEGAAGRLRLGRLSIDGATVAAQLWTVDHGVAYIHKLAYRADAAAHSPGSLLSAALFRHVIDIDKVAEIDFGTGDDGYKRDWMEVSAPLYTLELAHPFGLAGAKTLAKRALRPLMRRRAPAPSLFSAKA